MSDPGRIREPDTLMQVVQMVGEIKDDQPQTQALKLICCALVEIAHRIDLLLEQNERTL
jgi:hypothetical protein